MKAEFSTAWIASSKARKQRKYARNAPLHIKAKMLGAHLSKELRKKHKIRSVRIRTGDKGKIMRGSNRGKEGKVERVSVRRCSAFITGFDRIRADGTKALVAFHPSNMQIVQFGSTDRLRKIGKSREAG